jgi:hypothetical protein
LLQFNYGHSRPQSLKAVNALGNKAEIASKSGPICIHLNPNANKQAHNMHSYKLHSLATRLIARRARDIVQRVEQKCRTV